MNQRGVAIEDPLIRCQASGGKVIATPWSGPLAKKKNVFIMFGFDSNHIIRLLKYVNVLSEVDCSIWHLKCARQKHEIYHPSIVMRPESRVEKVRKTDQQCWAAELVILQVSAKEDIIVNLFRNDTVQEYLKSHITDYYCRITKLHGFCVSNPQDWIRAICEGSGCCSPHQTGLPHIHQTVEGFFFKSSPLVFIFYVDSEKQHNLPSNWKIDVFS